MLQAGIAVALTKGFNKVTRDDVARQAGVSAAMVNVRFGTMARFERALMRYAIRTRCLCIVAQGLALKNPHARKAPPELRAEAAATLAGPQ